MTLQQGLNQLVEAELIYRRGLPPQSNYIFKHALIQDTAYESLLRSKRQQVHQQIAQVLEERFSETVETQPELLAHHYTEAGLIGQAITYWQKAGQRAIERSAHAEAVNHLTTALELLKSLPDTPERAQQELTLQIALGPVLIALKGFATPEVEKTYARARELCQQMGETPQLFPVLWGLLAISQNRAEYQTSLQMAGQLLSLGQSVQDSSLLLQAHLALGNIWFVLGEFALSLEHLEQGIALYSPPQHNPHILPSFFLDLGVNCLTYAAMALLHLGYPAQALKRSREALVLAKELSHPFSLAMAHYSAAAVHLLRREGQAAQEQVETVIALSSEQGFPHFLALGTIRLGWALAQQGEGEEGIAQIHQGLTVKQVTGTKVGLTWDLGTLAEAYGTAGRTEEGLTTTDEALDIVHQTGERLYEAELYRLKGELLLAQEGKNQKAKSKNEEVSEAEACFQQAIEVARRQQTKSFELRAAMSLSRLWQKQGMKAEARQMLSEIYNWFTEGFDTKDLQEAKALLD